MEYFKQAIIVLIVALLIVVATNFLTGCANPRNNNNIHINLAQREQTRTLHRELMRNCYPRSKCPHLWSMIEEHTNKIEQGIINAT